MPEDFDVVIVGGGPAGEEAAGMCSEAGLATVLVEAELVGGECSYWACMPSKALLRPGEAVAAARRVPGAREAVAGPVDAGRVLAWRDEIVHRYDDRSQVEWLESKQVKLVRGWGRVAGERAVAVDRRAGDSRRLHARRAVVIATGSATAVPPVPGLREIRVWGTREATAAKQVPRRLLVLGGGVVGVEMGQAWRRLGAEEVTIVELAPRLLAKEEPFAGEELQAALEADGVTVRTGTQLAGAARQAPDAPVQARLEDGRRIVADELLMAVGRRPRTEAIGLETVGLEPGKPIAVDDQLRATGVPGGWLYAIGDVNERALLTHMGKYQARQAAAAIIGEPSAALADHRAVPRVVFTDPQVAAVGLTEQAARDAGMSVRTVRHPTSGVAGSSILGATGGGTSQLVIDEHREVVVGATFVGHGVAELLHSATVAVAAEVPLDQLWHAVPSFPTISEVWLRLLQGDAARRRTA